MTGQPDTPTGPPNTPSPWERWEGESPESWEAFIVSRDMGIGRSNAKVARVIGKSAGIVDRWSRMHGWVARFEEWDAELDRERRASQIEAVRTMAARHIDVAHELLQTALDALALADRKKFTPAQIVRFAEVAVKIERQALGEPTSDSGQVEVDESALVEALTAWFAEGRDEAFMAGAATASEVIEVREIEPAGE